MFSLLCVLVWVVAQPAINANSAMALIILNEIRICFIFLVSSGFVVGNEWRTFLCFVGSAYGTLVLLACGFRARVFHATKTEMIRAGVDFAFAAGADDVARAILIVAKK